jgi:hypothetical protein
MGEKKGTRHASLKLSGSAFFKTSVIVVSAALAAV